MSKNNKILLIIFTILIYVIIELFMFLTISVNSIWFTALTCEIIICYLINLVLILHA